MLTRKAIQRAFQQEQSYKELTSMSTERNVYVGKSLSGEVHVEAVVGGYAPNITLRFKKSGCEFEAYFTPHETAEIGLMLVAASRSAGGSALLDALPLPVKDRPASHF